MEPELLVTVVLLVVAFVCTWKLLWPSVPPTTKLKTDVPKKKRKKTDTTSKPKTKETTSADTGGITTEKVKPSSVKRFTKTADRKLEEEEDTSWSLVVNKRTKWKEKKKAVSQEYRKELQRASNQRSAYWDSIPGEEEEEGSPTDWKVLRFADAKKNKPRIEKLPTKQTHKHMNPKDITDQYRHLLQRMAAMTDQSGTPTADISFRVKSKDGIPFHTVSSFFKSKPDDDEFEECDPVKIGKLLDIYMQPRSGPLIGGLFISVDGATFSNEHTSDEFWMATTWIKAVTKILQGQDNAKVYPFWKGEEEACVMLKQSADGEKLQLTHLSNARVTLKETSVQLLPFIDAIMREVGQLHRFMDGVFAGLDARLKAAKEKDKQTKKIVDELKKSLPSNIGALIETLQDASKAFFEEQ